MAFGVMRLPADTFGVLSCFSRCFAPLGNFGFDAAAFSVVDGAIVELDFDEEEEFCEVGGRPAFDGRSQSFWNHWKIFTYIFTS
jgi:hypothetical protein